MKRFDYKRVTSRKDMHALTAKGWVPLAGGTDLVPLMQEEIRTPEAVVDIKHTGLPSGIRQDDENCVIGAMTTLSEIEHNSLFREKLPLLSKAAALSATRQLRNRATLGGNLLQASRCWYFRHPDLRCWLRGGDTCYAKSGRHERHALSDSAPCISVHPSDLAGCLVALDACISITSKTGSRRIPLRELLTMPSTSNRNLHTLAAHEVLTDVQLRMPERDSRSTYLKAMSRKAWSFALVGVAAQLLVRNKRIESAQVVLNGVAPTPWTLRDPASAAAPLTANELVEALSGQVDASFQPLPRNAYKLPLAKGLIIAAITELMEAE